ncbi:DUF7309 domain-containing protein [Gorillibacterium timonense]|uniref:DUF7309 domain-containing protein n=1 Tax=Gorillibacterium timonense TaxID=1689269 RepID=UPI00071D9344|nr:hypothetical protein [Gorillibacterium timonense]
MQPTREQWIALYESAAAFKKQASWEWLSNGHLFGIENPANGEIGYISILGSGGEAFGMSIYLGTEGLTVLMDMLNGEVDEEPLFTQHCLLMALNDREDLYPEERRKIKDLGLTFRGKNAWPAFLYYEPGYVPSPELTGEQTEFLTLALNQVMLFAEEFRDKADDLFHDDPTQIMVRHRIATSGDATSAEWKNEWRSLPASSGEQPEETFGFRVDELRLARMKKAITNREAVWEVDCSYIPVPLQEGERGIFPKMLMLVDQASGQILKVALSNKWNIAQEAIEGLLEVIDKLQIIPSRMEALTEEAYTYIGPVMSYFDIEAYLSMELPALEEARDSMMAGLTAGR